MKGMNLLLLGVMLCCTHLRSVTASDSGSLRIGAFNIQIFGVSKLQRPNVTSILTNIIQRYDIILIQEIRDASGEAILDLLDAINNSNRGATMLYNHTISERLGRTSSKEQYAFLYRPARVEILSTYQYDDSTNDVFQREPYSVLVRSKIKGIPDFFLTGLHTEPGTNATSKELNALVGVYDKATVRFQTDNGVLLGDFNADCQYLSFARYSRLELVTDSRFTWLINEDTTTGSTVCAYDRIVITGAISNQVVSQSAQVFRFDMALNLSPELTSNVSDHYPVEFRLQATASAIAPGVHFLLLFILSVCVCVSL